MAHRLVQHLQGNVVAYLALFLAIGGGGGYAIAATQTKTIHGCVVKSTGELLIKKRCSREQTALDWTQVAAQDQASPSAWALVSVPVPDTAGVSDQRNITHGMTVTNTGTGVYLVTVTAAACAKKRNDPVVSVSRPGDPEAGASYPVAWVLDGGFETPFVGVGNFEVNTGVVANGQFTPADLSFNIQDVCG
jgi:hypothetical protein